MPLDIDHFPPQFIDVDFPSEKRYLFGDTGLKHFARPLRAKYSDVAPIIPESQWKDLAAQLVTDGGGLDKLVTRVFDQDGEGSCVGFAGTQGVQVLQAAQFGKDKVIQLSPISLYKRIGRSPNSGSSVDDCLDELKERGVVPLDTPANRQRFGDAVMPETGFYSRWPANWEAIGKQFGVSEALEVVNRAELISALFNGHPVQVGRAGHSILYLRPVYKDGRLYVLYVNSWGSWGAGAGDFDSGFGLDSESYIRSSSSWAVAYRTIVVPDFQIVTPPAPQPDDTSRASHRLTQLLTAGLAGGMTPQQASEHAKQTIAIEFAVIWPIIKPFVEAFLKAWLETILKK